jgi:glycosyltransferase involved in cell wall biosynthesis
MDVFFAFRDAPERRAALRAPQSLDRYRLFGLDEVARKGARVRHNLERETIPHWARAARRVVNAAVGVFGGLGGDFAAVLPSRRVMNGADVVFSTVDTVGIPLLLLKRVHVIRPPLVYASIGLPERLEPLQNERGFQHALQAAQTIIAYSSIEAERLRAWIGAKSPPVEFVPFGVDVEAFRPLDVDPDVDVVSVGADPRRDFELLLAIAARRPELSFRIVATADRVRALGRPPANVAVEADVPLEVVRERLARARVVALPVRENSYSGATTTLLQGMAMAKPVVVSRTDAVATGYGLEDGVNCRLVAPGDADVFESALGELLANPSAARALGARARETVVRHFSWQRYTDTLWEILAAASERS